MLLRGHLNVGSWLQTDMQPPEIEVRLSPSFGHSVVYAGLPFVTLSGHRVP